MKHFNKEYNHVPNNPYVKNKFISHKERTRMDQLNLSMNVSNIKNKLEKDLREISNQEMIHSLI